MEKIKHTLTTRWKLLVVILLLVPGVLTLLWLYPPVSTDGKVDSTSVAAWVQGVGTVLAVLAAAWIARDQFDWQQRAETQRRQEAEAIELKVVRATMAEARDIIKQCADCSTFGTLEYFDFYKVIGSLDMHHLDALLNLLLVAPLSPAHGPALHTHLHKSKIFVREAMGVAGAFRMESNGSSPIGNREYQVGTLFKALSILDAALAAFGAAIKAVD